MKIKAALIDLNDTICNYAEVEQEALAELAKLFSDLTEGKYSEQEARLLFDESKEYISNAMATKDSSHDTALHIQHMVENADIKSDKFDLIYKLQDSYYKYILKNLRPYDDAEQFLDWLRESGRKIVIITDGTVRYKVEQIRELGITRYADYLVTSEESGANKPAPNSYMLALHKLQMKPNEVFVIGNSVKLDVYGANMLGMITVEANLGNAATEESKNGMYRPTYTVDALGKVRDIIEFLEANSAE